MTATTTIDLNTKAVSSLSTLTFWSPCVPRYLYGHLVCQDIFTVTLCAKLSLWPLCVPSYLMITLCAKLPYGHSVYQAIRMVTLCAKLSLWSLCVPSYPYGHSVCHAIPMISMYAKISLWQLCVTSYLMATLCAKLSYGHSVCQATLWPLCVPKTIRSQQNSPNCCVAS